MKKGVDKRGASVIELRGAKVSCDKGVLRCCGKRRERRRVIGRAEGAQCGGGDLLKWFSEMLMWRKGGAIGNNRKAVGSSPTICTSEISFSLLSNTIKRAREMSVVFCL